MKKIILLLSLIAIVGLMVSHPVAAQPTVLSTRTWGGVNGDIAAGVATDKQGDLYMVGTTNSYSPGGSSCSAVSILKYSPSGNLLWQRAWFNGSASQGTGVAVDPSGNVYVAGTVQQTCSGSNSGVLLKLDPLGNLVWQKTIDQGFYNAFDRLTVDSSGNVFVTGIYNGFGGFGDILFMRFDTDGNLVWQKSWGGSGPNKTDEGVGIAVDSQDNVYVTGDTTSYGPGAGSQFNLVLLKLNSLGQLVFQRIIGGGGGFGSGLAVDSTGNIYLNGESNGDLLLMRFDPNGNVVWQKSWGGAKFEIPAGLTIDPAGKLDIAGYTNSYGAGGTCGTQTCYDIVLMKLDTSGNILTQLVYGNANGNTEAFGLTDTYGSIVAAGSVGSGPAYQASPGNTTFGTPNISILTAGNSTLGLPTNPIVDARSGLLHLINGSQGYSSSPNQFMITFGNQPQLTISTTPAAGGTVIFNGTSYSNGMAINVNGGIAIATAVASAGYTFLGWNATGGIFLSTSTSNTTTGSIQVTVGGPGTLTARFQQTPSNADYAPYYLAGIVIASAIAIAEFFFLERKRQRSPPTPSSVSKAP